MDKEKILDELNNFKSRLNNEVYESYVTKQLPAKAGRLVS
jgi:hypothetical protein